MLSENLKKKIGITSTIQIDDVHWKTQDSTNASILFYKTVDGQENLLFERIKSANFSWLITNKAHPSLPQNSSIVSESDWPELQKIICDEIYPLPEKMKFIGITGTNGKTTTTDLVLQMGHLAGLKGISIGTLGVRVYQKQLLDFGLTSPPYIDLRKYLHRFGMDKDFCVMEASSHALVQNRLYKIEFDSAGWLSFSQDHLDYHGTMEAYFEAKSKILNHLKTGKKLFVPEEQTELYSKLQKISSAVVKAEIIDGQLPLFFSTRFNQNNLEVAQSIIKDLIGTNITFDYSQIYPPDGRFYIKSYGTNYIVVDFAHTPDALENICLGIKRAFPKHKLKVLFGCGGDRDRKKRPLMGAVVDKFADEIYLTSDNPRSEDPSRIIDDIIPGISKTKFKKIVERPDAVITAFNELRGNEVLLLAGKGHEDYILINGVKQAYSDIEEVEKFLARKGL